MKKNYFPLVDLSRFFAAVLVLIYHLGYSTWQPRSNGYFIHDGLYTIPQMSWAWFGYIGVQIFFVISGFVITNSAAKSSISQFVIGRITRLYPTLWICATITLGVCIYAELYSESQLLRRYLGSLLLLPKSPWMEGVYWTLVLEVIFYALVGLMILRRCIDRIDLLALGLAVYSGSAIIVSWLFHGTDVEWLNSAIALARGKRQLLAWHGVFFAMGIYFYLAAVGRLQRSGIIFAILTLSLCCLQIYVGTALPRAEALAEISEAEMTMRSAWVPIVAFLGFTAIIPVSIYKGAWIIERLSTRTIAWLRVLGLMSYPIYLLHFTLGLVLMREMVSLGGNPLAALLLACATVLILSWFIVKFVEPPMQSWTKNRLLKVNALLSSRD
ncbi:acyltransferase [Luteimonas sp. S4-F44]|uniref:acyltransferase family protein n=1 Tax=Luteimonas sp. S4-F44 TaxID=2925842 RepID=UPI001F533F7C|nr:acyltransferase [Luteimonas sp. S4-F44]UNK42223.1 acyltransferase [Luteimonas sp. S4-F44]